MNEQLTRLTIQVQPNARQNELVGFKQGILHMKIAAPPIKGKANRELIKYLSNILNTAKSQVTIISGGKNKRKVINIKGLNQDKVEEKLSDLAGGKKLYI